MFHRHTKIFFSILIFIIAAVMIAPIVLGQESAAIEERISELEDTIERLKSQIFRIGYIDRTEVFSTLTKAVKEERQVVSKIESKIEEFEKEAEQGGLSESKYNRQQDILQSKYLQARINVDLAILNKMIKAKGFSRIEDKLKELKDKSESMEKATRNLVKGIKDYSVSPKQVSRALEELENQQFKRLDKILTNIAHSEITRTAKRLAEEKSYDLVLEKKNTVLYRKDGKIIDLTEKVEQKLESKLESS